MKKILTLCLALALVFAIAAPAFAITGDVTPDETGAGLAPVAVDVTLLNSAPVSGAFGGFTLSPIAANKAYVVNEVAFYGVALDFVEADALTDLNMIESDFVGAKLIVSSDALTLEAPSTSVLVAGDGTVTNPTSWVLTKDAKGNLVSNPTVVAQYTTGNSYYYFGQGLVKAKGLVKAEFKLEKVLNDTTDLAINKDGNVLYTVGYDAAARTFTVTNAKGTVSFVENADEEVTGIFVTLAALVETYATAPTGAQEVEFKVPVSGGGSVASTVGAYVGEDLAAAKALYQSVMTFFGFNYDAEGVLQAKHFLSKSSSLYLKDEVAVNLYSGSIVTPPGGVTPPKTGDAASVMGFAMIVLAMVAAGAVVARKVEQKS